MDNENTTPEYWIATANGLHVSYTHPDRREITIGDIAYSLAQQPRFLGHMPSIDGDPMTIAGHCLLVTHLLELDRYDPEIQLQGLMHDAHEAYIGDMPTPLKLALFKGDIDILAQDLQESIRQELSLPAPNYESQKIVRGYDEIALRLEVEHSMITERLGELPEWTQAFKSPEPHHRDLVVKQYWRDPYWIFNDFMTAYHFLKNQGGIPNE